MNINLDRCNEIYNLSITIFELNFYQDQSIWKHELIPIESNTHESDRIFDLLIYKNHLVFIKKTTYIFRES